MFTLDQVVPWGRSFDEYVAMFRLSEVDLRGRILGCADGPASFNAQATRRGASVVSCDPIYRWCADEIRARIEQTYDLIMDQTRQNAHEFVWNSITSIDALGRVRMDAMNEFLADYDDELSRGRYLYAQLPTLPIADDSFDLALCSHLLFLYSEQLGESFHHQSILELARVAKEVRIFPLLALGGTPSPLVAGCIRLLERTGHRVAIEQVDYEFQRSGNQMLRIAARAD